MSKKRVNPRRVPLPRDQAIKNARDKGIDCALAMFFTAALDKGFITDEEVRPLWKAINELADGIAKGYVNLWDLADTLRKEYEIDLM